MGTQILSPYTTYWSSGKLVPAGGHFTFILWKNVLSNTIIWNIMKTIQFLYGGDFVGRENVNIRDKIFQECLLKKFRVILGVEIHNEIPHSIPH